MTATSEITLFRTVAHFATVQKEGARIDAAWPSSANPRSQLLRYLKQLHFGQSDRVQLLQIMQQLTRPPSVIRKSRITAARTLAKQEYKSYRRTLDAQPSPVEGNFDELLEKAKQLAQPKKKAVTKTEDLK